MTDLVAESDLEVDVVGSALDDLAIGGVGECSWAVSTLAVLALAVARSIATRVNETASLGEFVKINERNVCAGVVGVLKASLDEGTFLAVQATVTSLEVSDERVELSVDGVGFSMRENLAVLNQSGSPRTTFVEECDSVRLSRGTDGEEGNGGDDSVAEVHCGSFTRLSRW